MSDRAFKAAGAARRGDGAAGADARATKVRRNAWLLAGVAVLVYLGYIAWMFVRGTGG
ncbi:MAG TPA: hypothetical protein VF405_14780 [Gammaproteobacteria bacterium]